MQHFLEHFKLIDKLYIKNNNFPSYRDILFEYLIQEKNYSNIIFSFLQEKKVIEKSSIDKKAYQSLKTIRLYLKEHKNSDSLLSKTFINYYLYLLNKPKTSTTSVRLALTPANTLIHAHILFNLETFNEVAISSFIFMYPGYKASITGFINYLYKNRFIKYGMIDIPKANLVKTRKSKAYLKLQLVKILKNKDHSLKQRLQTISLCMEYFHKLSLPKYTYITNKIITKKQNKYFLKVQHENYYIPLNRKEFTHFHNALALR
ncbi:hypothetical protein IBE48_01610 [Francisella philomiragia]|nr:hypothetical protein [Francisella philomiragia]MBK2254636.1 hypothetical protein [Francisella philomiragia]MBK2273007.1 hypothetical protein [Francisella philomiragia]MBK2276848.1 hypothetical protein [Francisella philomiragia]MBK2280560.1 hypothetical protein [Francisella philomiragia]MBK2282488.1 hypothetical protein [Francisella philomiragia]